MSANPKDPGAGAGREVPADPALSALVHLVSCTCATNAAPVDAPLARALFHRVEAQGESPARAAAALGLGPGDCGYLLAGIRRDVASELVAVLLDAGGTPPTAKGEATMQARDIMTTTIISVPETASVAEATKLMLEYHVSALPVTGADGGLVGLISEGDLMRRIEGGDAPRRSWWLDLVAGSRETVQDFVKVRSRRVSDVMTSDVVSVDEETPAGAIARLLETHRIKRVPVLRDGALVGIVSRANLLHALSVSGLQAQPGPGVSDRDLRARVAHVLRETPGGLLTPINCIVRDGNVAIWGVADRNFDERAIRVAVENIEGVGSVEIHLGRLPAWGYGI